MQPNKINLLSTRPLPEAALVKAAAKGIGIDVVPFIKTVPIETEAVTDQIKILAAKKIIAVFTSTNAVNAVTAVLSDKPNWKIYCMGGTTKEMVFGFFGQASVIGTARHSSALATKIIADKVKGEVFFFCSDQRLDMLPEKLKQASIDAKEVVVYTTVQTPHSIEKNYEGIVFFSPSAVHSFFGDNTIATDVILFAIGETTATTISTYVLNEIVISKWPSTEQMIEQAVDYFESAQQKK